MPRVRAGQEQPPQDPQGAVPTAVDRRQSATLHPDRAVGADRALRSAVDRALPAPLHRQVRQVVLELIQDHGARPDEPLPTEEALGARLGVSRATVRQAMQGLVADGLLLRIAGKGTFVARPRLHIPLSGLVSWTEEMRRRGLPLRVEVLEVQQALSDAAPTLGLPPGIEVVRLRRLRWVEGDPVVFSTEYLSPRCALTPRDDFSGSLYALLARRGLRVAEGEQQIRAVAADGEAARLLRLPLGAPVLFFRRTVYDAHGQPLLYEESACRGDLFDYTIRLRRDDHP